MTEPRAKPTIALSTCWLSHRHTDGRAMLQEIASLGFDHAELSHGVRISLVPGILRAVQEGVIRIASTHNFCPLPTGVTAAAPNLFMPSAADAREQDQWFRHTRRSLDFAAQVGARAVVLHLGQVEFLWRNPGRALKAWLRDHPGAEAAADPGYRARLQRATVALRRRLPPYWARTHDNLGQMLGYAAERGIVLGLENREKFEELPLDADFPDFLSGLGVPGAAGYWHDTGHAQIKQRLGLIDHRRQLEDNAARLVGFHLHDVDADNRDHLPLGSGLVDFAMVRSFIRPHHVVVLELSPRVTVDEVRASRARLDELLSS